MSISSESIDQDITTDHHDQQEDLGPMTNLEPSVEVLLLRARLAKLEGQTSPTSSCASFELLDFDGDAADTTGLHEKEELHQMKEMVKSTEELVVEQMEGQPMNLPTSNDGFELLTYDVDYLSLSSTGLRETKEQRETGVAELEKQNVLQQEKVKLEEYQNEQQLNIGGLQKTIATMREIGLNRWDSAACHKYLTLSEPNRLIVRLMAWGDGSVIAEKPIAKNPYFEVKILQTEKRRGHIFIGLATKQMPLDKLVGVHEGTYAYEDDGTFWGHEVDGCSHCNGRPVIGGKQQLRFFDVVGCGVNLATRQIIYTRNGERLDTAHLFVDGSAADLFPCVSLRKSGTEIKANFGPNFKYNIADEI